MAISTLPRRAAGATGALVVLGLGAATGVVAAQVQRDVLAGAASSAQADPATAIDVPAAPQQAAVPAPTDRTVTPPAPAAAPAAVPAAPTPAPAPAPQPPRVVRVPAPAPPVHTTTRAS